MEVPLSQLKRLLQGDRLFRDYFNTFLNLPIFCRRLTYSIEVRAFEVDPVLQSPHNLVDDDDEVVSWLHTERLPLFWNSHLFLEYELCLKINESGISDSSLLDGAVEMNHFRQFLSGTEGEAACLFWLNVQHFLHKLHTGRLVERDVITFIKWIRTRYINEDARLHLNTDIQMRLKNELCCLNSAVAESNRPHPSGSLSNTHSRHIQTLTEAQALVLTSLKGYWYKKYAGNTKKRPFSDIMVEYSEGTATAEKPTASLCLPDIETYRGQSVYHHKTEVTPNTQPFVKLPDINSTTIQKANEVKHMTSSLVAKPLFSPSTAELFPHSNTPLSNAAQPAGRDYYHLAPFLSASLRADFLAENPFLCYLSRHCHDSRAVNYLLFWQSAESIFTMDEMRRWDRSRKQLRGRDSPCISYHNEFDPTAKNPTELVELFLMKGAPHMIELPCHHRERLSVLLPKGLGQSLLMSMQEFAAQQLLSLWKEFLCHDNQIFIEHCSGEKSLSGVYSANRLSPAEVAHYTYGSSELQGMWLALRLAEVSKYPGTVGLPSRRQTDMTLVQEMKSARREGVSIALKMRDLTGVSLNSMRTTVRHTMKRNTRRSLHTILSITKPVHSTEQDSKTKKKLLTSNFKEALKDREQMEQFYRFLVSQGNGCEVQLLFWLAVEDLKSAMTNTRVCSRKMDRIVKQFFKDSETRKVLQSSDSVVGSGCPPSPVELLAVQSSVREVMERQWYSRYIASLTVEEKKEEETPDTEQNQIKKTPICIEHTKDLWRMFASGVVSFRRGLMDPHTAEDFKSYLKEEVVRGSAGSHRKVVGTKVVYVTKLLNDLSFWAEVERYKDIADIVRDTKRGRHPTPEDNIVVHKKAHAIINCFIDSAVVPRVQINIPGEVIQYILDCVSQGGISRGLFHEAALNIFSVLILYWRKYLTIQHTRKKTPEGSQSSDHTHHTPPPRSRRALHVHKVASFNMFHSDNHNHAFLDIGPTLSFSLTDGLHWVHPSHRHHLEVATADHHASSRHHLRPHLSHRHSSLRAHNSKRFSIGSFHQSNRSVQRLSRHTPTTSLSVTTTTAALSPTLTS